MASQFDELTDEQMLDVIASGIREEAKSQRFEDGLMIMAMADRVEAIKIRLRSHSERAETPVPEKA